MRFISVRELRGKSAEVWRGLSREGDVVVTSKGKPIALLSAASEETLESSLKTVRRVRALTAVQRMQADAVKNGLNRTSLADINAEIAAVRRGRVRKAA